MKKLTKLQLIKLTRKPVQKKPNSFHPDKSKYNRKEKHKKKVSTD